MHMNGGSRGVTGMAAQEVCKVCKGGQKQRQEMPL